jgi:hydroxyacylglutathione hydrolase
MKTVSAVTLLLCGPQAWCQPVPGSLDVHWNAGAADCEATPQSPLQVHRYEPRAYILLSTESEAVRQFFGFTDWPDGLGRLDLGGRTVEILPAPGHHPDHLVVYDDRTALLLTGDFLLPGRLLIDDAEEFHASAVRVVEFVKTRPIAHVLGAHIELDATGRAFSTGSEHHPNERRLELTTSDLLALPAALENFNGFYASHDNFILSNPKRIVLVLGIVVVVVLALAGWGLRRLLRRRQSF